MKILQDTVTGCRRVKLRGLYGYGYRRRIHDYVVFFLSNDSVHVVDLTENHSKGRFGSKESFIQYYEKGPWDAEVVSDFEPKDNCTKLDPYPEDPTALERGVWER